MPTLESLNTYWNHSPPVHLLVKWFTQYKAEDAPAAGGGTPPDQEAALGELFMQFQTGQIG